MKDKEELIKEWQENKSNPDFDTELFRLSILLEIRDLLLSIRRNEV